MITGIHAIVFSHDLERTRAFFRDTLRLDSIDAGGGWLIFALPPAELAAHSTNDHPRHELYLMCDDIHTTVAELKASGIPVTEEIAEERWGRTTTFELPGAGRMAIYEPTHPRPGTPPS